MRRLFVTVAAVVLVLSTCCVGAATPQPSPAARVVATTQLTPTRTAVFIDSPSMQRVVQIQILHPPNGASRPTFYLLDGVDSATDESNWTKKTDAESFFARKNVNVVLPVGGVGSYYTDWARPDPVLGVNMWETFLTSELPPIIDGRFGGNGTNAIGGLSMGGQAALILATRHRDLYTATAAFSTCPDSGSVTGKQLVRVTVASQRGDATNMWGPDNDPAWLAHDTFTNAEQLRGKTLYISVGSGVLGPYDFQTGSDFATLMSRGAPLELGSLTCTRDFQERLDSLGIPAQFVYRPIGTHSWPYWQDDLHDAWPTIAGALGTAG